MKKGISPLIATVMLVMLGVILVLMFYQWGGETVGKGLESGTEIWEGFNNCEEVGFQVEDGWCDNDLLYVKINNEKNMNFKDGFVVKFIFEDGEQEIVTLLKDERLDAYEAKPIGVPRHPVEMDFGKQYKAIQKVEVIPKVLAGQEFQFCNEKIQKIEVENCIGI